MSNPASDPQMAYYTIRIVSSETGVNAITLRAWERRYGLITPKRTAKGHRLYTEQDIRLIRQVVALLNRGIPISQAQAMINNGEELPVDLKDRFIYYVGPVDPVRGEAVGPAGPTTATRMDKFTRTILDKTGLLGMIGKSERGPVAIEAIKEFGAVYLMAVGGAAYLVSKAIKKADVVAFPELGMEAIYEFDVVDMPVTVAVDTMGTSVHITGPAEWKAKIEAQTLEIK